MGSGYTLSKDHDNVMADSLNQDSDRERLIINYILGELPEEEAEQVEALLFNDNQYFEQMLSIEGALIDDYVQNKLPEDRREKVEQLLHSSKLQSDEADFVKGVIACISDITPEILNKPSQQTTRDSSAWRSLMNWLGLWDSGKRFSFAVSLISIVFITAMMFWNFRLRSRLDQVTIRQAALEQSNEELREQLNLQAAKSGQMTQELESERNQRNQLEQEVDALKQSRNTPPAGNVVRLALSISSFTRGEGRLGIVHVTPGKTHLQLHIDVGPRNNYKSYSVVLKTFDGREIWRRDNLQAGQTTSNKIVLTLRAGLFDYDDYLLELKGKLEAGEVVEVGEYSFRVAK